MSRRVTPATLAWRQLRSEPGTAVLVAGTVLVVALVLGLWPRAVDALLGEDVRDQLGQLTPAQRDLSGLDPTWFPEPAEDPADALDGALTFDRWSAGLEAARAQAGPALTPVLAEAEVTATRGRDPIEKGDRATDVVAETLAVRLDPEIADRVDVVEGRSPGSYDLAPLLDPAGSVDAALRGQPVEVMASVDTADRMRWSVGETRQMLGVVPFRMTLVGTFEAVDPDAGYWSHHESTLFPFVLEDGNVGTTVNGIAYADVSALGALQIADGLEVDRWYRVDVAAAARADRTELLRELRTFLTDQGLRSELTADLEALTARHGTLRAVLDVLAVGPVGAAVGALWLTAVLATARRRDALRLVGARGASASGIRTVVAAQGLAIAVPAAVVGAGAAALLLRRDAGPTAWLLPLAVGLTPAVLLAAATGPATARAGRVDESRRDPAHRRPLRRRLRTGVEVGVVLLAALLAVTVRSRGLLGADGSTDPGALVLPLLLATAAALVVVRVLPPALRVVSRALHRRRGLPHLLGAAEATRTAGAGVAGVVALTLAVGATVLSGITWVTVERGLDRSAATAVGADLRVEVTGAAPDATARVAALDGVVEVATVGRAGTVPLQRPGSDSRAEVLVVDVEALRSVQTGLPALEEQEALTALAGTEPPEGLPVVLDAGAAEAVGATATLYAGAGLDALTVVPVAATAAVPGVTTGTGWVVVDAAVWREATGAAPRPAHLLLDLAPGADPAAVTDAVRAVLGDDAEVTTPGAVRASLADGALPRGLRAGLAVATGLAAALTVVVVALALAVRAPERGRLAALLATVGAPRGTAWRVVAWELVPLLVGALVAGALAGGTLVLLVLPGADLRPFTGGTEQPALAGAVEVGVVVVVGLTVTAAGAVAASARRARRTRTAVVLREGER